MSIQRNYITGHTSEFNEFREGAPVNLESGGFLICTSGHSRVVINSKQYSIGRWDMVVAFPYSYAHAVEVSEDFNGVIFGVDMEVLLSAEIEDKGFYIASITENPCVSLRPEEARRILDLRESFLRASTEVNHPFRREIDEGILNIIIYEIAALFRRSKPNSQHCSKRDDLIFNNFIVYLHSGGGYNRTLDHFAEREHITPSHLSKVVKRVSGRTPSEWISGYIIASIMRMLQRREFSVERIADELRFPNASFLAQYFKKHTSKTPREYRKEFFGMNL